MPNILTKYQFLINNRKGDNMFIVSTQKQYDTCDTFLGEEILFEETNNKSFKDFADALKYMHQQANKIITVNLTEVFTHE